MKKIILVLFLLATTFLPLAANAAGEACTPDYKGSGLCNALPGFGGNPVTDIPSLINASFSWLAALMGTLLMVMLFYSGARMVISQGDKTAVTEAKNSFKYTIYGFLITIFGYVIVSTIQYALKVKNTPAENNNFFYNPINSDDAASYFSGLMSNFLAIIGSIALLYLIISGFKYLTAGGNDEQTKKAKEGIQWTVIGIVCVLLTYTIIRVLFRTFR